MGIKFEIDNITDGLAFGYISWPEKGLNRVGAFSGPYGRRELPAGLYHVKRSNLLDKNPNDANGGYCDSLGKCWFQKLEPQFSTNRSDLGIHPDGNKVGTLGCIGLLESNTSPWYDAFYSVDQDDVISLEVIL